MHRKADFDKIYISLHAGHVIPFFYDEMSNEMEN